MNNIRFYFHWLLLESNSVVYGTNAVWGLCDWSIVHTLDVLSVKPDAVIYAGNRTTVAPFTNMV